MNFKFRLITYLFFIQTLVLWGEPPRPNFNPVIPDHISRYWDFSDDYSVFSRAHDSFLADDIALQKCMPGKPSIFGFHGPSFKGGAVVPFVNPNTRYVLLAACNCAVGENFESAAVQLKRPVVGFSHEFLNQAGVEGSNRGLICQTGEGELVPLKDWGMKAAVPCKDGRINVVAVKHPERLFRNIPLQDGETGGLVINRTARSSQPIINYNRLCSNGTQTCVHKPNIAGSAFKNLGVKALPIIGKAVQAYLASGTNEQLQIIKVIENRRDLSFGDRLDCAASAIICTMDSRCQSAVDKRYRAAMRKYDEILQANAAYFQKRLPRGPIAFPTCSEDESNEALELAIARKRLQQALRE